MGARMSGGQSVRIQGKITGFGTFICVGDVEGSAQYPEGEVTIRASGHGAATNWTSDIVGVRDGATHSKRFTRSADRTGEQHSNRIVTDSTRRFPGRGRLWSESRWTIRCNWKSCAGGCGPCAGTGNDP